MDYLYHYYNDSDHHSTFSPIDQCLCPSSTFLLSVNILLLAILIYTLTMEKTSMNPLDGEALPDSPSGSRSMVKPTIPKTLELLRLPDKPTIEPPEVTESLTTITTMATTSSSFSSFTAKSSFYCPDDERLISLESTTIFNEALASPSESHNSINSFGSSGSFKRKLIKPDFSLSFFDTSMSSTSIPSDEDSRLLKVNEDDSLRDFNVLIHNGIEEEPHPHE